MPPAPTILHYFLLLIFFAQYPKIIKCQCYDFGGNIVEGDRACYQDRDHSFCCGEKWTCLSPGICSRENSTEITPDGASPLQRATCTDKTWKSKQCPQFCTNQGGPRGMKQCDESYSTFCCVWTDCCGGPNGRQCLEEGTPCRPQSSGFVNLFKDAVPLTTIGKPRSAQSTTSILNSISTTPIPSITSATEFPSGTSSSGVNTTPSEQPAAPSSKHTTSVGVIAGVTVAAAVSVMAAALALLWWRRRRAHVQKSRPNDRQEPLSQSNDPQLQDVQPSKRSKSGFGTSESDGRQEHLANSYHSQNQGIQPKDRSTLGFASSELSSPSVNWHESQSAYLAEAPASEKGPQELPTKSFDAPELPGSEMSKH